MANNRHNANKTKRALENRRRGEIGEQAAQEYLHALGTWRIITRNWACSLGEIDIIAEDNGTLVFVEVKTRASNTQHNPDEAIDGAKRSRIRAAARAYLTSWQQPLPHRYDTIAVWLTKDSERVVQIELRKNAFCDDLQ